VAKLQRKYRIEIENVSRKLTIIEPPFTIDFDIMKAQFSQVASGSLTIYNLGETTRNEIYKDLRQVGLDQLRSITIFAGYEGETLSKIFKGTISHCYSRRQGVDFLTVVEFNSGSDFIHRSYVTMAVNKDDPIQNAIVKLAREINPSGARYIGNVSGTFKRSNFLEGNAAELIKQYSNGLFFIDDDDIFVLNDDEVRGGIINEIDSDSGLLGSPQREEDFLVIDLIFEPRFLLGQKIRLKSSTVKFFNGDYKIVGIHHTGTISESISGTAKTTIRVSFYPFGNKLVNPS